MEVFFIDQEGNKISSDKIESHVGLINLMFEENPELKAEFENSKEKDSTVFLIKDKGYIAASQDEYQGEATFNKNKITDKQKRILMYYREEEGYRLQDISMLVEEYEKEDR